MDPVFTDRKDLEAWAFQRISRVRGFPAKLAALKTIDRVTLAHLHLPHPTRQGSADEGDFDAS